MFIWRRASPLGRASPLCRDPASQLNSLSKFIFVYERRASPPWRDLAIYYPRSRLAGLEIFHINALKSDLAISEPARVGGLAFPM